ncbi:V-type proton ATPase 16 kDa proteolipid subunit-like isoform X1 [Zingiber officinale]|uniref:V-type proton ATPase 16 kDa proteolipid subunit-like isoform X1 n=1 Tax=Zingiber officinale TaxID=94328 RepID=UPI001C4C9B5F|nr:V-type proton ATPase 16 kDa proteolipid subunit-like isoform X1 [Zingiber officinale]
MSSFSGDETAPFFGFLGAAAALVFSCMGAAYGTAKSGVGVASMGVMRPELVMKSIVPVVMAGVLGIYGLIIAVIISTGINPKAKSYYLFDGYAHLSSGLACGLAGLSAGMAIGIVGDAGVSKQIVSASLAGDIQFLDVRNQSEPYLTIDAHRGSLAALAIHRHALIIASGSAKQIVKAFSLKGEQLSIIRYYPTFMAQRIGSVSCLTFHPYRVLLAIGAADACVSIYADDTYQTR